MKDFFAASWPILDYERDNDLIRKLIAETIGDHNQVLERSSDVLIRASADSLPGASAVVKIAADAF